MRLPAIMVPPWYSLRCSGSDEDVLSICEITGGAGGNGGKLYSAASVAILRETITGWEEGEKPESREEPEALVESSSDSQYRPSKELCGTGGRGGDERSGW